MNAAPSPRSGFSLVEVLAAITIIGIITFLAIPNIVRIKKDGEDNLARARAEAANMAIASYVQAVGGPAAQSNWTASTNRFGLIVPYLSFAETNASRFMPSGYTLNLPTNIYPSPSRATASDASGSQL